MSHIASTDELREKLLRIASIEEKHNLLGVSFSVREGATVLTEEGIQYVSAIIESGLNLLEKKNELPRPKIKPDQY